VIECLGNQIAFSIHNKCLFNFLNEKFDGNDNYEMVLHQPDAPNRKPSFNEMIFYHWNIIYAVSSGEQHYFIFERGKK